ncbi:hypothetical protein ACLOJK_006777 [Asimina triloba]
MAAIEDPSQAAVDQQIRDPAITQIQATQVTIDGVVSISFKLWVSEPNSKHSSAQIQCSISTIHHQRPPAIRPQSAMGEILWLKTHSMDRQMPGSHHQCRPLRFGNWPMPIRQRTVIRQHLQPPQIVQPPIRQSSPTHFRIPKTQHQDSNQTAKHGFLSSHARSKRNSVFIHSSRKFHGICVAIISAIDNKFEIAAIEVEVDWKSKSSPSATVITLIKRL